MGPPPQAADDMAETAHGPEGSVQCHAPDCVVDEVKSLTASITLDVVLDCLGAIVDERCPGLLDGSVLRLRIGREDFRAKCSGDLDRHVPHAAGTTVN